jgi:hypothetical protein
MDSYIKHIVEAFDFSSINKQKKSINAYDILLPPIFEKLNKHRILTLDDYNILK